MKMKYLTILGYYQIRAWIGALTRDYWDLKKVAGDSIW